MHMTALTNIYDCGGVDGLALKACGKNHSRAKRAGPHRDSETTRGGETNWGTTGDSVRIRVPLQSRYQARPAVARSDQGRVINGSNRARRRYGSPPLVALITTNAAALRKQPRGNLAYLNERVSRHEVGT